MKKLLEIESDCLDIVKRLKEIDHDYFVLFDLDTKKFQLHNRSQKIFTYCLTFPFDTLDERAIVMAKKTRVENSDKIFEQMEKDNQKLQQEKQKQILSNFKEKLYDS